jgi:hypothetical protein
MHTSQAVKMRAVIDHLAHEIGGRGTCTPKVRRAARYVERIMRSAGVNIGRFQPFFAISSTYAPFLLAFLLSFLGSLAVILFPRGFLLLPGLILNVLALGGLLAETDLAPNWMRALLPKTPTQNLTARIEPQRKPRRQVVLCAHLDTHRTPVFYSSSAWITTFSVALIAIVLGMFVSALIALLLIILPAEWLRYFLIPFQAVELFAIAMCIHADLTPYSPGANDDASGVSVVTVLACQLAAQPLKHTIVHVLFTDGEEAGCTGMQYFLMKKRCVLPPDTLFLILDEVGAGTLTFLAADGLLFKHRTHPTAVNLIQQVQQACPTISLLSKIGLAYTDALVATKAGYPAITLVNTPSPANPSHWHQGSDTSTFIEDRTLKDCFALVRQILNTFDEL